MNKFVESCIEKSQEKLTENGAFAYNTSGDKVLDFFSTAGALRSRTEEDIIRKFELAYLANRSIALRMLFYTGDVRGGLGERKTFRVILNWLGHRHPQDVIDNLENIPFYNRYDSLFSLVGTRAESAMWAFIRKTLNEDLIAVKGKKSCSLLAKWMPSINTSSKKTRDLAELAWVRIGCKNQKAYRTLLSFLRSYIDVVERRMSLGEWEKIQYEKVPAYAMKRYSESFFNHDEERFEEYLEAVKNNKKEIKANVLYPYDLVHQVFSHTNNEVTELQWKALPNYIEDGQNILVMADVSGSMTGRPMETSIGLATYFAQHNTGDFHNCYMSFTNKPHFIELKDEWPLEQCVRYARYTDVGYSTNLEAAFAYILQALLRRNVSQQDAPKALVVISDMEIDPYFNYDSKFDFVETWRKKFNDAGYEFPKLVLWNVESRQDTYLTKANDVLLFSGQSASTFKNLCKCFNMTAWQAMIETLYGTDRYERVVV